MKKFALLVTGMLAAGMASAVEFGATAQLTQAQCNNLNENVTINLTNGVVAGVDCKPARVAIGACHTAGMLKSRTVGRKVIQVPDTTQGAAAGATVAEEVSCTVGASDADCAYKDFNGAAVATATTLRGTVNPQYPGGGACTSAIANSTAAALK